MNRDMTEMVMATLKLSMVITPHNSTPQSTPKTSLQDIAYCSINVVHHGTLFSVNRALDI
jgi:hypothetical protein